jgi:protein SCO1/2
MRVSRGTAGLCLAVLLAICGAAQASRGEQRPVAERPTMDYVPPPAGSYRLNVIQPAPDGLVVAADGRFRSLAEYTRGRITLLSLIYTYCTEPTGCTLAYETEIELKQRIIADQTLHDRVRFVSLSFDPVNDDYRSMQAYGGRNARSVGPLPWFFLATRNVGELRPILDGFDQEIEVERDSVGRPTRTISHMLKLFLIDRDGMVREIYSTAFLHPEAMLNDIKTLVMEEDAPR